MYIITIYVYSVCLNGKSNYTICCTLYVSWCYNKVEKSGHISSTNFLQKLYGRRHG